MGKYKNIFLSHVIATDTPSYGNRDSFKDELNTSFKLGDKAETSNWSFSNNHFGTHIDAPRHFMIEGKTVTDFDANFWVFSKISCVEVPCSTAALIGLKEITSFNIDPEVELLLFKTGYEQYRDLDKYWNENPGIAPELGVYLKEKFKNLRAIGFDFISVTSFQHRDVGREAHLALLDGLRPILPIEDMSLALVTSSSDIMEVVVSPLRVFQSNGSPVTVIASISEDL
jgi:kynurenine formamidase